MRFDLIDLQLFLRVTQSGSITAGAKQLHMTLASASSRLSGMEDLLGTALLDRHPRGVTPTAAGRSLAHHAAAIERQLDLMKGELGHYAEGLKAELRLLSNTAALSEFLPDLLSEYLGTHPNVDIRLDEKSSTEIVQAVSTGRADLGIVADTVDLGDMQVIPLWRDQLVAIVPAAHPLAHAEETSFETLLTYDFIGLTQGSALQEHLFRHAQLCHQDLKLRVRLRSFESICRLVEQGIGVAIIPDTAARRHRERSQIKVIPIKESWTSRRLCLVVRDLDALPSHARSFVELARSRARHADAAES
ncbi:LysR family transcriptional regulator [Pararobbsia silviterrae]|nr:LysR substrate-binding domain-containing protein [Pararobbsia silviterrae]